MKTKTKPAAAPRSREQMQVANQIENRLANIAPSTEPASEPAQVIEVAPPLDVTIALSRGIAPAKGAYLSKAIGDARSRVGTLKTAIPAGERVTGSLKKGSAVLLEGVTLSPAKCPADERAVAVLRAANALARALAMDGSTKPFSV